MKEGTRGILDMDMEFLLGLMEPFVQESMSKE
jgi:hypothetical protein